MSDTLAIIISTIGLLIFAGIMAEQAQKQQARREAKRQYARDKERVNRG